MSIHYGIVHNKEISLVTVLSESLINQYRQIIEEANKSQLMSEHLSILLEQSQYRRGLKKTIAHDGLQVAVMAGV